MNKVNLGIEYQKYLKNYKKQAGPYRFVQPIFTVSEISRIYLKKLINDAKVISKW